MPQPKTRTSAQVYDALKKISDEEGVDFGLDDYSQEDFNNKYFTGPGNIENLYNNLSKISDEEGIDFGQGSRDEWLASFGYRRAPGDTPSYLTLDGRRVGGPSLGYSARVEAVHSSPTNVAPHYKDRSQIAGELGEEQGQPQGQQSTSRAAQQKTVAALPTGREAGHEEAPVLRKMEGSPSIEVDMDFDGNPGGIREASDFMPIGIRLKDGWREGEVQLGKRKVRLGDVADDLYDEAKSHYEGHVSGVRPDKQTTMAHVLRRAKEWGLGEDYAQGTGDQRKGEELRQAVADKVFRRLYEDKARQIARMVVSKIPVDGSGDGYESFRDAWYDDDVQREMNDMDTYSGISYRNFLDNFVKPALVEEGKEKLNGKDLSSDVAGLFRTREQAASHISVRKQLEAVEEEKQKLIDQIEARKEEIRRQEGDMGTLQYWTPSITGAGGTVRDFSRDVEHDSQMMMLRLALAKNSDMEQILRDRVEGKTNSYWHSLWNTLTNGYTFMMGVPELREATSASIAKKHADSINEKKSKGEELTAEEKAAEAALRNMALDNEVQSRYGDQYGLWARSGMITGTSAGMLPEFLYGMPMMKAISTRVAKVTTERIAKAIGADAMEGMGNFIVRSTGCTLGTLAAGTAMSNTIQMPKMVAGTLNKMTGNVSVDDAGNYHFEDSEGLVGAWFHTIQEMAPESASEMAGEYLGTLGRMLKGKAGKALSSSRAGQMAMMGASKLSGLFTRLTDNTCWRGMSSVLEKMGFHGAPAEAMEEYVGMIDSAIMGDLEGLKSLADIDTHLDIWVGCATMGALFQAPALVGSAASEVQYRRYQHKTDVSSRVAALRMGEERWQRWRERADGSSNEEMKDVLRDLLTSEDLTVQEKAAGKDYIMDLMRLRGYNAGRLIQNRSLSDAAEGKGKVQGARSMEQGAKAKEEKEDAENYSIRYESGYNIEDPQEKVMARIQMENARKRLGEVMSEEMIGSLEADGLSGLRNLQESGADDEVMALSLDYVNARAIYDGMEQRVDDDIDTEVAVMEAQVDDHVAKEVQGGDGMIHPATLKIDDRQVYVVSGHVVMTDDGSMVNMEASDDAIIVKDAQTGKLEFVSAHDIRSVGAVIDPTQEKTRLAEEIRSRMTAESEADISGEVMPGRSYTVTYEDGDHSIEVLSDNGDGTLEVRVDGREESQPMAKEQLQAMLDAKMEEQGDEQGDGGTLPEPAVPESEGVVSGAPAEYVPEMELTIRDDYGSESPAKVKGRVRYENGRFVPDEKGNIVEYSEGGEVKHEHAYILDSKVVSHVVPQQPEAAPVQENVSEAMPMVDVKGKMKPDWGKATPARAHAYLYNERGLSRENANAFVENNRKAAASELEKLRKKQPKMGTDLDEFEENTAEWQVKMDELQRQHDYWQAIKDEQNKIIKAEAEERAKRDAEAHDAAVLEEQQRQAEELAKREEQAERGAYAVHPAIRDKWESAPKIDGVENEITLANGERVKGHYVLVESGAATPSHNPNAEFARNEGFPVDENGNTVNDRDYERDKEAQAITRQTGSSYDSRAIQNVPVVSNDGVVLSGNGRTMAGELAARDNTDGAYIEHLRKYPQQFGFTAEQVQGMQHPRVLFVPEEAMPYTTETFAKFNAQDMKSQSRTEQSVKLGKTVDDATFNRVIRIINGFDTLGDFYNDSAASTEAIAELRDAGAINSMQYAEMFDGEKVSGTGRQMLENMLIGKAFESNPDAIRQLSEYPAMRQSVISALAEISNNVGLGEEYSLESELAEAINLAYQARKNGYKAGEQVSNYARQLNLFPFDMGETVADYTNATVLMLADMLNDNRVSMLKKTLAVYNHEAAESAAGQMDLFSGGVKRKEEIIKEVLNTLNHGTQLEQQAALAAAVERRKAESVVAGDKPGGTRSSTSELGSTLVSTGIQQDGTPPAVNSGSEDTGRSERSEEEIARLTHNEAIILIAKMEERADVAPDVELTIENWDAQFGEDGRVNTPIGDVKMGENQFTKLMRQGREGKLGMIKPTLETPDVIIEDASEAKEDDVAERNSSYVFVKAFKKADGSRYYYFTSVTVSKDGKEVVISNQEKRKNAIANLLTNGKLVWKHADDVSAASDVEQGLYSSQGNMSDPTTEGTDAPQTNDVSEVFTRPALEPDTNTDTSGVDSGQAMGVTTPAGNSPQTSVGKVSENSATVQGKGEKVAENQTPNAVQAALAVAERETNTEPTEAQKEAGNYKKGHVKIDGYDVTIENPKGSVRRGTDASGKQWEQEMQNTYGYIRGTEGVDGDHIDVFFSDDPSQGDVFVVDQVNKDGSFDEHKVMYGFPDIESARKAYLSNYEDGWQGLGAITPVSKEEFKKWINSSHRKTKPFAEYSSVKKKVLPGHDLQEHVDSLAALQDNGKSYDENVYDAYSAGRRFGNGLSKSVSRSEAMDLASKMVEKNQARGGLYTLPFLDGVTDSLDLRQDKHIEDAKKREAEYRARKKRAAKEGNAEVLPLAGNGHLLEKEAEKSGDDTHVGYSRTLQSSDGTLQRSVFYDGKLIGLQWLPGERLGGAHGTMRAAFGEMPEENYDLLVPQFPGENDAWEIDGRDVIDLDHGDVVRFHNEKDMVDFYLRNRQEIDRRIDRSTEPQPVGKGAFEKKNSALDNTTDTGKTSERGKRNDTATPQSTVSDGKDSEKSATVQGKGGKNAGNRSSIQGLEDYSEDEILKYVREHFDVVREDNDADAEIVSMKIIGSRTTGTAKEDSDLDVLLEYKGREREDDLFNMLYEEPLVIGGIEVDINPITEGKSGTIKEFEERNKDFRKGDSLPADTPRMQKADGMAGAMSEEERELGEALDGWLGEILGDDYSTDHKEGQRVLDEDRERRARMMGSRVEKRKARIASELRGRELSDEQQVVADVFTGAKDNQALAIADKDGKERRIVMRQGNERGAGTKHSIFRHYGTTEGVITADDILKIPDVLARGERKPVKRGKTQLYEYTLRDDNGTEYTVLTEYDKGREAFADFYTNKRTSSTARLTTEESVARLTGETNGHTNTQSSARASDIDDVSSGAKLQKVSEKDKHESEKIFDAAKKHFGTTTDIREAGYILPDGTMLDFSGRHEMDEGMDTSWLRGERSVDHRDVKQLNYEIDGNTPSGLDTSMPDFIERGAIRIDANAGTINLSAAPTPAQKAVLRRLIARNDGEVSVDFGNGWDSNHYAEYDGARPQRVLSDIDRYFDEGIKPMGDYAEGVSYQKVAPVFYSNAERAVEGIRQEKATPDQWLAMVQKAGGLKAGEDKWLGLSEWLKGQDKKSLTKQEVLDYIRKNQVQVEEVEYGDSADNADFEQLKQEYDQWLRDEGYDYAWEQLRERFGDDAEIAFTDLGGELEIDDADAAATLLGSVTPINETRLNYTTEGLENKREIVLTVPTIEPWNESDEVHFGDAGEGRAVAWVRFGETREPWTEEVIDEVNDFAEPVKNREHVLYYPEGSKGKSRDFVVYTRLRTGEMKYVVEINGRGVSAHDTLEDARDAMNAYYKEHPRKVKHTKRVLVIDEIQSKRHQEGREKGYRSLPLPFQREESIEARLERLGNEMDEYSKRMAEKYGVAIADWTGMATREEFEVYDRMDKAYNDLLRQQEEDQNKVPDAPFEKNWHEVAMKRMLRYAAENGYDKVAWTTGAQQAERYNLGDVVSKIETSPYEAQSPSESDGHDLMLTLNDGTMHEMFVQPDGTLNANSEMFDGKNVADVFGKGVADKIMSSTEPQEISGDGLRVGGEGMKGFYDEILPRFMDKYGRKWGVKTKDVELPLLEEAGRRMHSVDVTEEMKATVMEGQPMFFRTEGGEAYGFTLDGKIYIDPRIASSETRVHEYAHLWAQALRRANPEAWEKLKGEMLGEESLLEYVKGLYPEITDEDELMEEVFAHFSGKRGVERLRQERERMLRKNKDGVFGAAKIVSMFYRLAGLLREFWQRSRELFAGNNARLEGTSGADFADMMMADLMNRVDPRKEGRGEQRMAAQRESGRDTSTLAVGEMTEDEMDSEYMRALDELNEARTANAYAKGVDVEYADRNGEKKTMRLHATASEVESMSPTKVEPHSLSRDEQFELYKSFKPEVNDNTGEKVEFYNSAFKKNHREGGLFEKIVPQIRELFRKSVLAYSEEEQLAGSTRRDGTVHKEHRDYSGFGNYLNKVTIDGKEYYVRFTVQKKKNESGLHSTFVTNVEVYDNPAAVAYGPTSNGRGRLDYDRITDAKLRTFFEKSKDNSEKVSQIADTAEQAQRIEAAESRMREILDEVKRRRGYDTDVSYQGSLAFNGAAPSRNVYFETKEERKQAFEEGNFEGEYSLGDFMDNGLDGHDLGWQINNPIPASGRDKATLASIRNIAKVVRGKKRTIKMYRAVDADIKEGSFRNGDWVTPSREYAEKHIGLQDWEKGRIIEQEVSVDDIWWDGNDINEWGYDDGKGYAYSNTPNNRKLTDLVTYDDAGNVIPPSERFNKEKDDIRYRDDQEEPTVRKERREVSRREWLALVDERERIDREMSETSDEAEKERLQEKRADVMAHLEGVQPRRSAKERREREAFARRQWERAKARAREWVEKLGIGEICQVVDSIDDVEGSERFSERKRRSKGWYDVNTGKIVIVVGNHRNPLDVVKTILHEAVAHYGLRQLFGQHFDTFLDNVYDAAGHRVAAAIDAKEARLRERDAGSRRSDEEWRRVATEEYLAELAEDTDFEAADKQPWVKHWFNRVKEQFLRLLGKLGLRDFADNLVELTDNELRYILWRSYENMANPGWRRDVFGVAEDVVMKERLTAHEVSIRGGWTEEIAGMRAGEQDLFRDEDDEAERDEVHGHVEGLRGKHALSHDLGMTANIWDEEDMETLKARVPEIAEELEREYNDPLTKGCHVTGRNLVVVFTGKCHDKEDAENVWWHEQAHVVFDRMSEEERTLYGEACLDYLERKDSDIYEKITKNYDPSEWNSEACAYFISEMMNEHGAEKFLKGDFEGQEELVNFASEVVNSFKHGRQQEQGKQREQNRVLHGRTPDAGLTSGLSGHKDISGWDDQQGETKERINRNIGDGDEVDDTSSADDDADEAGGGESLNEDYDAGRMTLDEAMAKALYALAERNKGDVKTRLRAMRAIGGNLSKLRQAMARQKEYDRSTVDAIVRLARALMSGKRSSTMRVVEVNKLIGLISKANTRNDITEQARKVVDMMVSHLLKEMETILHQQMKVKGSKVNSSGVEVQGGLDIRGQRMMQTLKDCMDMKEELFAQRKAEALDAMSSESEVRRKNGEADWEAIQIAKEYRENIAASKEEEKQLRHDLREEREAWEEQKASLSGDELKRARKAHKEFVKETEDAILANRCARIEAYEALVSRIGREQNEGRDRAKEWVEKEKERVNEIRHWANSDMQGMDDGSFEDIPEKKGLGASFRQFLLSPLATFDYMLKLFGRKAPDGRGYLWNHFFGDQYMKASDSAWKKKYAAHQVMDAKAREVMGKEAVMADGTRLEPIAVKRWSDLFSIVRKMPKVRVTWKDGVNTVEKELTQGNLLYLYMVNKMSDGRMKLRRMGIGEELVEHIKDLLDPRFIEIADWLQGEFLVKKRDEYNEVHEQLFGAPMASIDNYFPLKINDRSRHQEADVNNYDSNGIAMASTVTGSVIKRVKNSTALDMTADAFDVALGHVDEMEEWAAFAPLRNNLNTLLSYGKFRNRVLLMESKRYGSGKELWNNFVKTCAIAAGQYRPKNSDGFDDAAVNISKGVTAAKIAFRKYTALKQLLSYPAYLSQASVIELAKTTNPKGAWDAWHWCMDNMPGFAERWQSRQAGDTRLMNTDSDWKLWKNDFVQLLNRLGMTPNAFVDAVTVCMGSKAIYETKKKRYLDYGFSEAKAHEMALRDAWSAYNETQQSSVAGFTSAMQLDRTVGTTMVTVFRNASMGYERRFVQALNNLGNMSRKGFRQESIEYLKKQMMREGLDEVAAERAAVKAYNHALRESLADTIIFGWVMQAAWNLGPYLGYLLIGGDDDKKEEMLEDAMLHALAGGVEGFAGGNVISELYNLVRSGENIGSYNFNLLPMMSDVQTTLKHFDKDAVQGIQDILNLVVQAGVGVNPQTLTDAVVAILDATNGDIGLGKEIGLVTMRVFQFPQSSSLDELWLDEIGLTPEELKTRDVTALARRYAAYKRHRNAPLLDWLRSEERQSEIDENYMYKNPYGIGAKLKERMGAFSDEDIAALGLDFDEMVSKAAQGILKKRASSLTGDDASEWLKSSNATMKRKGIQKMYEENGLQYASPSSEGGKAYERYMVQSDVEADMSIKQAKRSAEQRGDEATAKSMDALWRTLNEYKKMLLRVPYEDADDGHMVTADEVMGRLREVRGEQMKAYLNGQ